MEIIKFRHATILILLLFCCCNQTVKKTDEEKIIETTKKMLNFIADSNYQNFKELMYPRNVDDERLIHYFNICHYCIKNYSNNIDSIPITISDEQQIDSTTKVVIPIFKGFDSTTGLREAQIEVFFGIKRFVPLNQITHFFVKDEYNVDYRKKLLETGKLKSLVPRDSTTSHTFEEIFFDDDFQ